MLLAQVDTFFNHNTCPITRTTYIDLLNMIRTGDSACDAELTSEFCFMGLHKIQLLKVALVSSNTIANGDPFTTDISTLNISAAMGLPKQSSWLHRALATNDLLRVLAERSSEDLELQTNNSLQALADYHSDVCCHVIKDLEDHVVRRINHAPAQARRLGRTLCSLIQSGVCKDVQSRAYHCLVEFSLRVRLDLSDLTSSGFDLLGPSTPPFLAGSMITIWGMTLSQRAAATKGWTALSEELVLLSRILRVNLRDDRVRENEQSIC